MLAPCPSQEELRRYILGQCDDASNDFIEQHLNECASCESSTAALDSASDSLLRHLPLAAAAPAAASERAPGWLAQLRNGPRAHASPPSFEALLEPLDQHSNYELLGILGRGGMGVVYRGRHRRLNRIVALKVLGPRLLAAEEARRRFEREIRILGSLKHPGIVMATDAGQLGAAAYLVMEYVDGADLARIVRRAGPLHVAEACEVARQMAEALAAAHDVGAIHRDIKPSNAMIDRAGRVKLLDFGLAFLTTVAENESQTSVGRFLGTLEYMAPEQLDGVESNTHRADIYGLGATLFFLLTGRPPHAADAKRPLLEQLRTIASSPAPRIASFRADVPAELDELISRMLSRDPAARPEGAGEIAAALERWAGGDLRALVADVPPIDDDPAEAAQSLGEYLERSGAEAGPTTSKLPHAKHAIASEREGYFRKRIAVSSAATAFLAVVAWSVIVLLRTPDGTLRIESEVADVRVEVVDENNVAREWTVESGDNATTLRAGRYRVRLAGEHDGLTLDRNAVVIRRGKEVLARISRAEDAEAQAEVQEPAISATAISERIYEGQPESVWKQRFVAEQSPAAKIEAALALLSLSSELPPPERLDRIVEIGSRVVEAGWGTNHLLLAVSHLANGPDNDGARWPLSREEELKEHFTRYVRALNTETEQIPEAIVAEKLATSFATGSPYESSFAAWLLHMRMERGLSKDAEASRTVLRILDVRPDAGFPTSLIAVLLRTVLIHHAEPAQREQIVADFQQLARLLLDRSHEGVDARLREAWHNVSKTVPASEWAARLILDDALTFGTRIIDKHFGSEWFKDSMPYADGWVTAAREKTTTFREHWASVVNEYLASHPPDDVRPHLPAIVLSLDYLTRMQFENDEWDLPRSVELLRPYLQAYYTTVDGELTEQTPEAILPVPVADLLMLEARVNGEIPAFVREGRPRSASVVNKLALLEQRLSQSPNVTQFVRTSEQLSGLLEAAPYHSVRITLSKNLLGTGRLDNQFGTLATSMMTYFILDHISQSSDDCPVLDPLLLLAIVAPLTGESEVQDMHILELFYGQNSPRNFVRHLDALLSGPWKMKSHVRRLLTEMRNANSTQNVRLREVIDPLIPTEVDQGSPEEN